MAYLNTGRVPLAFAMLALIGAAAQAQTGKTADLGKQEYVENCAVCHGSNGKGGGALRRVVAAHPS
jgi:mono/diheme cytochrome c family protein